jgi:hypothetical protein
MTERDYEEGRKAAWLSIYREAVRELGIGGQTADGWQIERQEAIRQLRTLCDDFNLHYDDWPDDLHLGDVIEKYIYPSIDEI